MLATVAVSSIQRKESGSVRYTMMRFMDQKRPFFEKWEFARRREGGGGGILSPRMHLAGPPESAERGDGRLRAGPARAAAGQGRPAIML